MFSGNVQINSKISIFFIACILSCTDSKKDRDEMPNHGIVDMQKFPVAIKFGIPRKSINDDHINPEIEKEIRRKILVSCPELDDINLAHFKMIKGIAEFYEYAGAIKKTNVNMFVFKSSQGITIKGFSSEHAFERECRYRVCKDGVRIFKRTRGTSFSTVEIFYQFSDMSVCFYRDDGFSQW